MDKNCVEDICRVLKDILLVCDIINGNKYNRMLDDAIQDIKLDVEDIMDKYT